MQFDEFEVALKLRMRTVHVTLLLVVCRAAVSMCGILFCIW